MTTIPDALFSERMRMTDLYFGVPDIGLAPASLPTMPALPMAAQSGVVGSIIDALSAAPALAVGLGVIVLVPVLLLAGFLLRPRTPPPEAPPRQASTDETARLKTEPIPLDTPENSGDGVSTQALRPPPRPTEAVISVRRDGESTGSEQRYPFARATMMRIGRDEDNEIVLAAPTVHRFHAVIRRTMDAGYVITDLSADGGNGVLVNGRRVTEAQLREGDEIRLGDATLSFALSRG